MTVLRAGILILLTTLFGSGLVLAADTTPPTVPGQPREGTTINRDEDYDADGRYMVFWSTSVDRESGVTSYEVQEQTGASGPWIRVATSRTPRISVSGRRHGLRYAYRVRAQNRARLWSDWSPPSNGILVDLTPPTAVTVSDDGATMTSTTTLHAGWTASSDAESGIAGYEYVIRQDSTAGPIIKDWTSAGLTTEVTRTTLQLSSGSIYYIGVRAKNRAGLFSKPSYSDGILVQPLDTTPPKVVIVYPKDGALFGAH